jgi:ATP-dependent helicase/nuclease subunit A
MGATEQQRQAIYAHDNNVIVSAGAGSGKTYVLKERVLDKVKNKGKKIDEMIILTFTNNAAAEMKERIRKILKENGESEAEYVDSAYITTFDSFAGSLVKKYNYLLNMSKDFSIIESSIINIELKNKLDDILEEKYANPSERFKKLINDYCTKSDKSLRDAIINVYNGLGNIINKDEFLDTYVDKYYNNTYVDNRLNQYITYIFNIKEKIEELEESILDTILSDTASEKANQSLELSRSISTIDELIENINSIFIPPNNFGKVYDESAKPTLTKISELKTQLKKHLNYSEAELKEQYLSTKDYAIEIISILKELDKRIKAYKQEHNSYEFSDIAFKAIELVKNNPDIRDEIKYSTHEIMIDEYQDTNDIQEEFVSEIANHNVYMVGDIKQSIYGFRNANPLIFKEKYDSYGDETSEIGRKIDLTKNFRSRDEVINNINKLFSLIMFDSVGGAAYEQEHCMEHGKEDYDKNIDANNNYDMDLLTYNYEGNDYTQAEIEAFIIANDIEEKMNQNFHVFKEVNKKEQFVDISYNDFCILVKDSAEFDTLKQILESKGIPTVIEKAQKIQKDDEIYILKNIISCLTCIAKKEEKEKFKHSYASIARSYIFRKSDNDIYDDIVNNKYKESNIYKLLLELTNYIYSTSNKELLYMIVDKFDIINKTITKGSIKERNAKLEYFIKQSDSLNKFGMDIFQMEEYFDEIINNEDPNKKIEIKINGQSKEAVTIMTIHGSKGLEYSYVYMPYLNKDFKFAKEELITLDKEYGLILKYNDGIPEKTFIRDLFSINSRKDTISEEIRLFYVAITRAREKLILISNDNEKLINEEPNELSLLKCKTYTDFLTLAKDYVNKFKKEIDINTLGLNNNYSLPKNVDYKTLIKATDKKIITTPLNLESKPLESKHFSKELKSIMTKEMKDVLDKGTLLHYCFEVYNFKKDNLNELHIDEEYKNYIRNFLKHDEVKDISKAITYKEHDIRITEDGVTKNGVIDLLVEYDDHFDIIDYKTDNIDSEEYVLQLNGYKNFIENTYNKTTNIYLYSIKKDIFKKI